MNILPTIVNVADLQRNYRKVANQAKEDGEAVIVVNNGQPDIVVMDVATYDRKARRLMELEEENLFRAREEALREHKEGKTIKLGKNKKLKDLIY